MAYVKQLVDRSVVPSESVARARKNSYRIAFHRIRAGASRADLAAETGRSVKMIARYENGEVDPPADVLVKMASYLETTVDQLLNLPARLPSEIFVNGRTYVAVTERAASTDPVESGAQADLAMAAGAGLPTEPAAPPADERDAQRRRRSA